MVNHDGRYHPMASEEEIIKGPDIGDLNFSESLKMGNFMFAWSGNKLEFRSEGEIVFNDRVLGTDKEIVDGLRKFFVETKRISPKVFNRSRDESQNRV